MPSLPLAMGWILLADPNYGLLNSWLRQLGLMDRSLFNLYSFWGIIWVHLATATISVQVCC